MNRNFGYYGNNRLQQQTYAHNLYRKNVNGTTLVSNPQTSNGNASNFNNYTPGSQTTYTKGLTCTTVSVGGTAEPVKP